MELLKQKKREIISSISKQFNERHNSSEDDCSESESKSFESMGSCIDECLPEECLANHSKDVIHKNINAMRAESNLPILVDAET